MKSANHNLGRRNRTNALLVIGTMLVLALCGGLYFSETAQVEQRLRERESVRVGLLTHFLASELRPVVDDLRLCADGDGLRSFLATGRAEDLARAVRRAVFVSQQQPNYDQVRFLNDVGREVFRVNRGGEVVPSDQLQDKSNRPYFLQAGALAAGQIYVSAVDLNIEHGVVEQPLKPTVRLATPVRDATGRLRGVYVINYLAGELMGELQRAIKGSGHRFRLLNAEGFWLKASQPAEEWAFMFPERAHLQLAKTDPELWAQLSAQPEGQVRSQGGLFTWQRVAPASYNRREPSTIVADEPYLIVASAVSHAEWEERFAGLRHIFLIITPGLLLLIFCIGWFVRERERDVQTLRESEESLAVTLNSIGDGVLATDTDGRVTRLNRVAEVMTGWPRADAVSRPIGDIFRVIHAETRQPAVIPVRDVLLTGKIQELANNTVLIARDGTEHAIADSAAPITAVGGKIIGVVLVFRDVSEERANEAKLAAARSQLDRFFTLSLDFLCISSGDGYFKRVSPAVTDILGWSTEEFIARPYLELIHPDDHAATLREVERQMVRGEKVFQFENRYRHKDGSWRVLSWRSAPQPDGLMYATARDVTLSKQIEAEVLRLNADLQRHAAKLETANKELESFSYSVSHDLRAPLRHVQGYVDLLSQESGPQLSDTGRRYLKVITDAARNMGQLIDDLLAFSRMGRTELRESVVDLDALVAEVRQLPELQPTGREIQWKIGPLPQVRGDRAMLRQVWINLLGNAVKYTRGKSPAEITVECTVVNAAECTCRVTDNGAGFDMKYAGKLFGVFQRLHRADEFEGTGIGLANVRRVITRHGGRIWAEGAPGVGASFFFTLTPAASTSPAVTP